MILHFRQDPCEVTDVPRNRRSAEVPFWLHLITVIGLSAAVYKCEASKVNKEQGLCERDRLIPAESAPQTDEWQSQIKGKHMMA